MEGNNTYWVCSLNSHNNPVKQVLLSQVCEWGDGGGRGQEPAEGWPRSGASHPSRAATASSVPLLPKWCLCSPFQVHGNGILDGRASFREAEWRCEKLRVPPIPDGVTVLSFTSASIKMKAAPPIHVVFHTRDARLGQNDQRGHVHRAPYPGSHQRESRDCQPHFFSPLSFK